MDESKLKEYLRRIITKELDEMSGTGALGVGAGEIQTPYWVHKGKGDNNATKEAERLGFKKVKTSMPSDSKVKDYKSLWGKKSKRKIYNESDYDKASPWGAKSPSDLPSPSDRKLTGDNYYKTNEMKNIYKATPKPSSEENLYETIEKLVKKELLNEVSYGQFKNEVKLRSKQEQLHKAMREVKRKLNEIERIVEYTGRMKQELSESEGGVGYWNHTAQTVSTIADMVESLNTKIQNLK